MASSAAGAPSPIIFALLLKSPGQGSRAIGRDQHVWIEAAERALGGIDDVAFASPSTPCRAQPGMPLQLAFPRTDIGPRGWRRTSVSPTRYMSVEAAVTSFHVGSFSGPPPLSPPPSGACMTDQRTSPAHPYRVLARQYRPATFPPHDYARMPLVRTLYQCHRRGRLAHRAICYGRARDRQNDDGAHPRPAFNCIGPTARLALRPRPRQCRHLPGRSADDRHMDVIRDGCGEAATGVGDIRN